MSETRLVTIDQFETILKEFFESKKKLNAKYSLRQMASQLGVVDSTLQKVMRGERKLGLRLAKEIAQKLNYQIQAPSQKPPRKKKGWQLGLDAHQQDQVSWLNLAILEMIKLKDFRGEAGWISKKLGVDKVTVEAAIQKMEHLGMLRRVSSDHWIDLMKDSSSGSQGYMSTAAVRAMQVEILQKSMGAVKDIPYEQRKHGFSIVTVSSSQLPKIKKRIQQLRWDICEYAQNNKADKDQVYVLQVGFFPMTEVVK